LYYAEIIDLEDEYAMIKRYEWELPAQATAVKGIAVYSTSSTREERRDA
jgi:hypothetical protein